MQVPVDFEWVDTGGLCFDDRGRLNRDPNKAATMPRMLVYQCAGPFVNSGVLHTCADAAAVALNVAMATQEVAPHVYMHTRFTYRTCATEPVCLYTSDQSRFALDPWAVRWTSTIRKCLLRVCKLLAEVSRTIHWYSLKPENIVCMRTAIQCPIKPVSNIVLQNLTERYSLVTHDTDPCCLAQPVVKLIVNCMVGYERFRNLYDTSEPVQEVLLQIEQQNPTKQNICSVLSKCAINNWCSADLFQHVKTILHSADA